MAIPFVVKDLAEAPDAIRDLYKPIDDGTFVLDVSGHPEIIESRKRVAEFRTTNINQGKELEALRPLKDKYADIDVDEYKALKAKAADLEKRGIKDSGDLDVRIKAAVQSVVDPLRKQLEASEVREREAQARADAALLRKIVGDEFLKASGQPEALDYIVLHAPFAVVNNTIVPKNNEVSHDGSPLSVREWMVRATKDHSFVFKTGGGGGSSTKPGNGSGRPGVRVLVNPSPTELGLLKFVPGKGLVDASGQVVETKTE